MTLFGVLRWDFGLGSRNRILTIFLKMTFPHLCCFYGSFLASTVIRLFSKISLVEKLIVFPSVLGFVDSVRISRNAFLCSNSFLNL